MQISYFRIGNKIVYGIGVSSNIISRSLCKSLCFKLGNNIGAYRVNNIIFYLYLVRGIAA